jgi:hypothetical protein
MSILVVYFMCLSSLAQNIVISLMLTAVTTVHYITTDLSRFSREVPVL